VDVDTHLNDRNSSTGWTDSEDRILLEARCRGESWHKICDEHFANRKTPNACRKHHERLQRKDRAEALDGEGRDNLVLAYSQIKGKMWAS